ncbi:response regulator [Actinoplanes friuliensis]|uniref:LuxR family transcriptional regulator n=1 Tax=Actinoplanes friuliensis DSM 7358 TaxID=1246995 RepID=U5W372_9ACTN|nr:response regulator transcription factor [Actinoplanes friuliensis]AGZ43467.1 LuxR family transcriptional regulator [Actinoplanes friuliensis DSM 7358]
MTIRVLLADDQMLIRAGFKMIIDSEPEFEVVGEATDGRQAVDLARRTRADVILMDIRMPHMDGLEATRRIGADDNLAGVRVLVLTTFENDDNVVLALQAGASGFLGKGVAPADLLHAIRVVAGGEALLSPKATRGLVSRFLSRPETATAEPVSLDGLTEREREILVLVAHGLSNDDIAERLYVSPLTAKTHVNRAMTKLNVRDRAQLVVLAYRSGLVRPGEQLPAV